MKYDIRDKNPEAVPYLEFYQGVFSGYIVTMRDLYQRFEEKQKEKSD